MKIVNASNFDELKKDHAILFWGPWCLPCNEILNKINDKVACLNVDENYNLVVRYKVVIVPTLLIFEGDDVSYSFVGLHEINRWLDFSPG